MFEVMIGLALGAVALAAVAIVRYMRSRKMDAHLAKVMDGRSNGY